MPNLTLEFSASAPIGAETVGPDFVKTLAVGRTLHDKIVNVPGATGATYQTIWDSSVDSPTTFSFCSIAVDPDNIVTTEKFVDVRVTINAITPIFRVSTFTGVLALGKSAQGTGAITKIEVANLAGTTVTSDDVLVRINLWKA